MQDTYQRYLRDTFHHLREMLAKARERRIASNSNDGVEAGYELGLVEAVALLLHQADAFGLERASLAMEDFDPYVENLGMKPLTPPKG